MSTVVAYPFPHVRKRNRARWLRAAERVFNKMDEEDSLTEKYICFVLDEMEAKELNALSLFAPERALIRSEYALMHRSISAVMADSPLLAGRSNRELNEMCLPAIYREQIPDWYERQMWRVTLCLLFAAGATVDPLPED